MLKIPKYIYLTFVLFSLFFMGSFHVFFLSMRNIATILFLLVAIIMPSANVKMDGIIKSFIVYLTVLVLCNMINGEVVSNRFIHISLAFMFPSVVALYALPKFLKDRKDFLFILGIIIFLYLLNSFVTYGQYAGNSVAWMISSAIGFESLDKNDQFVLGISLPGLTGDIVNNGYFLATFIPIATIGLFMEKRLWHFIGYGILLFAGFCMFVLQQRMAFLSFAIYVFFIAFIKRDTVLIISAIIVFFYMFSHGNPLDNIETGRLNMQTRDESRITLFANFVEFAQSSDVWFGGIENYLKKYGGLQHNCFTAAFVLGGVPTFIAFVVMFFKILVNLEKTVLTTMKKDPIPCTLAVSCLIYAGYGMTHSSGLQNEGLFFWICYSILISYNKFKQEQLQY